MPLYSLIQKYGLTVSGTILGSVAGYLYYRYIGCASGTCPITANPYISTLYGAVMGGLLFHSFNN